MLPEKKNSRPDGNLRNSFKSAQQVKNLLALFLYANNFTVSPSFNEMIHKHTPTISLRTLHRSQRFFIPQSLAQTVQVRYDRATDIFILEENV